jgi:hypothetical protein
MWGKAEGFADFRLRYVPLNKPPRAGARIIVKIAPPLPPPQLPLLTVEGETFTGRVTSYRPFNIRLKAPLAPGHRWEVKEAVVSARNDQGEEIQRPFIVEPEPGESGLFKTGVSGETAHIVFIQKSDGWQLFPDTVTLTLTLMPVPLC